MVQFPTTANFHLPIAHLNRKAKNKEKEAGNGPFLKKEQQWVLPCYGCLVVLGDNVQVHLVQVNVDQVRTFELRNHVPANEAGRNG